LNIPLRELETGPAELPRYHEIVAYCHGPYCVLSFEAVAAFARAWFQRAPVRRWFSGMEGAGLAIEAAEQRPRAIPVCERESAYGEQTE
jgi:hypothetical protein